MAKRIGIIGAGIAGLSAGCYARMNGYDAVIYEVHSAPGGLCTSWKRKDYLIDGCLHWLTGSSPADSFYKLWLELGAIQGRKMVDHEVFYRYVGEDGRTFSVYVDPDKLKSHMKDLAPADAEPIELLCRLIRRFSKFHMPVDKAPELFNYLDIAKMMIKLLPFMKDYQFCNRISVKEFAQKFTDPLLRETIPMILYDGDMSLTSVVITLALLHNRAGGYPIGGSLAFSRAIERRFLDLGGTVRYRTRVDRILVRDGKAVGLRLSDGTEEAFDYVISACDLKTTLEQFLEGKYGDCSQAELLKTARLFPSSIQVSFGVNMDLSREPSCLGSCFKLANPITYGTEKTDWLLVRNYSYDPTIAPAGKTVVEVMYMVNDFPYWENLYKDKAAYQAEKERIAHITAEELNRRYPGFASNIEVTDVVTPMTYLRYTGNWKGTYMTWLMTPEVSDKLRIMKKTIPGIENFWLSGMWVMPPGGVPTGAKTSRDVIQVICRKDGRKFTTSIPGRASAVISSQEKATALATPSS